MIQSRNVDFVGLDVFDRPLGTEVTKPVGGLVGGVHLLIARPQAHREHLALLCVGEEQGAIVSLLHLKRRYDVLCDRLVLLLYAFGEYVEAAYPREHNTTAFLA